jgi:hypothetical protein
MPLQSYTTMMEVVLQIQERVEGAVARLEAIEDKLDDLEDLVRDTAAVAVLPSWDE